MGILKALRKIGSRAASRSGGAASSEDGQRLEFYRRFVGPGDLVFDVGANLGNRSRTFLDLGARVVAFEPQQDCARHLSATLGGRAGFTLVQAALGASAGRAQLMEGAEHVLATLSPEWIERTTATGRFGGHEWNKSEWVEVTTLDAAIAQHGVPRFVKIDVEGFEREVLAGLGSPVAFVSLEFAVEAVDLTRACIDRLEQLEPRLEFQLSLGESMNLHLPDWVGRTELEREFAVLPSRDRLAWGDVYIRAPRLL